MRECGFLSLQPIAQQILSEVNSSKKRLRIDSSVAEYLGQYNRLMPEWFLRNYFPRLYERVDREVFSSFKTRSAGLLFRREFCRCLLGLSSLKLCSCGKSFIGTSSCCSKSCVIKAQWANPDTAERHRDASAKHPGGHHMRNPRVIEKMRAKERQRTGYDWHTQRPEQQVVRRERSLKRYGVPHPIQDPEIFRRQQAGLHKIKWTEVQGKVVPLRGYEPQVIESFLSKYPNAKFMENSVSIAYDELTKRGDYCTYSPDFELKLKDEHLLVEVKGLHTLKDDWEINLKKFRVANAYAKSNGMTFVLMLHNPRLGKTSGLRNPNKRCLKKLINKFEKEINHGS